MLGVLDMVRSQELAAVSHEGCRPGASSLGIFVQVSMTQISAQVCMLHLLSQHAKGAMGPASFDLVEAPRQNPS